MTALLSWRSLRIISPHLIAGKRFYNVGKASSVTSAIARALRKTYGRALDTKKNESPNDPRVKYKEKFGLPEYNHRNPRDIRTPGLRAKAKERNAFAKSEVLSEELQRRGWGSKENLDKSSSKSGISSRRATGSRSTFGQDDAKLRGGRRSSILGRRRDDMEPRTDRLPSRLGRRRDVREKFGENRYGGSAIESSKPSTEQPKLSHEGTHKPERSPISLPIKRIVDSAVPFTIPYTTPASEFLYGASVVEAALKSRRNPRRQLYKLYIYKGENRAVNEKDAEFERLARLQHISIKHVGKNNEHLLNKLSGGRPHNGYILEASPIPRLPITKLGAFTNDLEEQKIDNLTSGFSVTLDYQSKEEAAVNGNSNFIYVPKNFHRRKPLVLFLDGILDPQNLGGIIRTASFLGVSAVATSTSHSAPFSPVVLKASSGAAENMNLLSIKNPESFIKDSKAAGWKIYAAVAPTSPDDSISFSTNYRGVPSLSTDQLLDPLADSPAILMLGSEGDGLRKHIRKLADVELFIRGSARRESVDSLNVNVATGVLCNAFIKYGKIQEDLKEERRAIEEGKKALEVEKRELEEKWTAYKEDLGRKPASEAELEARVKQFPMMGDLF